MCRSNEQTAPQCILLCLDSAARSSQFVEPDQSDATRPASSEKINRFRLRPNHRYHSARPPRQEGRIAIVTNAGWDAVDAAALARKVVAGRILSVSDRPARRRTALFAYGKTVWFWHPLLVSSRRRRVGPTGLGQSISADDGDKTNSSPGRSRHKP